MAASVQIPIARLAEVEKMLPVRVFMNARRTKDSSSTLRLHGKCGDSSVFTSGMASATLPS
jgi:hypothetical protein